MASAAPSKHPWDDVRRSIERAEDRRLATELEVNERSRPGTSRTLGALRATRGYLGLLGGAALGIGVGFATAIFNYLLFVSILHVEL